MQSILLKVLCLTYLLYHGNYLLPSFNQSVILDEIFSISNWLWYQVDKSKSVWFQKFKQIRLPIDAATTIHTQRERTHDHTRHLTSHVGHCCSPCDRPWKGRSDHWVTWCTKLRSVPHRWLAERRRWLYMTRLDRSPRHEGLVSA